MATKKKRPVGDADRYTESKPDADELRRRKTKKRVPPRRRK